MIHYNNAYNDYTHYNDYYNESLNDYKIFYSNTILYRLTWGYKLYLI